MSKILILGAGGMAGSMISKYLVIQKHDVTAFLRKDFDALKDEIPNLNKYDYVINCIGLIKQKSDDSDLLYKLNAKFPKKLSLKHKKLIHISSDCVFSGKIKEKFAYSCNDVTDAEDDYGKSKAQGEMIDAMVLRTSIIGPAKDNSGLFEWLRNSKEFNIKGFYNHFWNGITTLELSKIIHNIIIKNEYKHGVSQLGSNCVSKLELLHLINSIFFLLKNIIPYEDVKTINRNLFSFNYSKELALQLYELKEFMNEIG